MDAQRIALRSSVERLRRIVEPLSDDAITQSAYPSEWTIAQVMSHIGSGAMIFRRRLEDALASAATPDDFAPSVWDVWNAKAPRAQTDDALVADAELLARVEAITEDERAGFTASLGPMTFDAASYLGLRVNEHAFHTWDIEVTLDDTATLAPETIELVVDNLELVVRFTARPTGDTATIAVRTTSPERGFVIEFEAAAVSLSPVAVDGAAELELPAEAFARLVYGRLDADHTPPLRDDSGYLTMLRTAFPGP